MDDLGRLQAQLGDRYQVARELGHGGMALVYLAEDVKLHRRVAIKVLRPEIASIVGRDRFLREIEIAARLQHPGILPLFDSGGSNGFVYYVMPYVEGESLRERLKRDGHLPLDEALRIAREVVDALDYAHAHGVIHRDIKPENILLEGCHAVVADFGIARAISQAGDERLTASGHTVGTPTYMSPEQAAGTSDLDGRSDIYSLSCVLYEMLAGRPPFTGPTVQAIITSHLFEPPPSLAEIVPDVPPAIAATIEKGLAKEPTDRFDTPSTFSASLEVPVAVERARRTRRRLVWTVGLAAALALVAVTLVLRTGIGPPIDPNRVVVFPPIDHSGGVGLAGSGRDVAAALEMALDQTDPLKWVDGWERLPPGVREDPGLLTADIARGIALDRRAGYYIVGALRVERDLLAVMLDLHDAKEDSLIDRAVASGHASVTTAAALGLEALIDLLPSLVDPGRESFLPALANRRPRAIALCIQGEREYRLSHFTSALDLYERALAEDSLLALAAMKGALAAVWEHDAEKATQLSAIAVWRDSLLPDRYAHLARGIAAFFAGDADSAAIHCKRAESLAPDWTEALTWLAEVYYHLLPSESRLDSLAEVNFQRAAQLDTGFTPPLFHLAEIALVKGELERSGELIDRLASVGFDTTSVLKLRTMLRCRREGPESIGWEELTKTNPTTALLVGKELSVAGADAACAERGFEAVLSDPETNIAHKWGAVLGLQGLWVAQGRYDEALALLDSVDASGVSRTKMLYVFDLFAGAPFEAEASGVSAFARELFGDDYGRAGSELQWLMGVWHARSRNVEKVERIMRAVEAIADSTGSRRAALHAESLAGHLALARGDTSEAIARFAALRPNAGYSDLLWRISEPLAVEKMLLAELLLSQGEYRRAIEVAGLFDHRQPVMFLPYLAKSLGIRLRAAEALGVTGPASRYRRRLLALGRDDLAASGR